MSKNHALKEEDEEESLKSVEIAQHLDEEDIEQEQNQDEEVLDLSLKSKIENFLHTNSNKRKKKPIKSTAEIEEEQVVEAEHEPNEEVLDSAEFEANNTSLPEDDYLSNNNQDDFMEPDNQTEVSINDSTELINEDEKLIQNQSFSDTLKKQRQHKKPKTQSHKTNSSSIQSPNSSQQIPAATATSKKQMRFQCRFCIYKSHSVSLMQNHIYRHIDTTPYSCFYCGHKSTTKSTIMVHIELCHPNMEVKIKESRVKEEDYYLDLNSATSNSAVNQEKFELLQKNSKTASLKRKTQELEDEEKHHLNSILSFKSFNSTSPSLSPSSESSVCSSPSQSPNPHKTQLDHQLQMIKASNDEDMLHQANHEHVDSENKDLTNPNNNANGYITVFNRPKQYFGSLYEPDKQYSCKLCTYTTNHKPSMEDHVYVHTNKRPYRCGYCNEEIYTRYAATYHNKYKHPGEARNFIKDEQDVSIYYVNRAKKNSSSATSASSFSCNLSTSNTDEETANANSAKSNKTVENSSDTVKVSKKLKKSHESQSSEPKTSANNNQSSSLSFNTENTTSTNLNHSPNNNYTNALNQLVSNTNTISNVNNNSPSAGYDYNLVLKMYQIQLQNLMAANYLQSIRSSSNLNQSQSSNPQNNPLSSYFGFNQDQLQQLANYLGTKSKFENEDQNNGNIGSNQKDSNESADLANTNEKMLNKQSNKLIKNK